MKKKNLHPMISNDSEYVDDTCKVIAPYLSFSVILFNFISCLPYKIFNFQNHF